MARALRDPGRLTPGAMTRWMAWAFAVGSTCFLVGPFPGYQSLVGEEAAAATFFAGSLFFTAGGALQVAPAAGRRHAAGEGAALWRSAVVQPAATLFFNVTTFMALSTAARTGTPSWAPRASWRARPRRWRQGPVTLCLRR